MNFDNVQVIRFDAGLVIGLACGDPLNPGSATSRYLPPLRTEPCQWFFDAAMAICS